MDYQFLSARLESFSSSKSKRSKASSSRLPSSSFKWPHPASFKATPDSLAEAGFYFNPSSDSPDCATCYMCNKSIVGWEHDDDPFAIHYEKCQDRCAWAIVRCQTAMGEKSYRYTDPARHPASKSMEKARLDTFSKSRWPHDAVKGHGANSKALAKAGFVCNSESMGDDTAVCLYCKLSLGGWDKDDDPYEEHVKRKQKKCAFLKAYTEDSLLGQSTSKRPTSKPASKASKPEATAVPMLDESDDELAVMSSELSPPLKTSSTRASKAGSVRSSSVPVKTPGSRRSTRGTGKTPGSRTVSSEVEETDGGSESDAGKRATKSKRKTGGRSKTRVSAIAEEGEDEVGGQGPSGDVNMEDANPEPQPVEKKKRGRPPKSATAKPQSNAKKGQAKGDDDGEESDLPAPPPPAKKSHTRSRSKANVESEAEDAAPSNSKSTHTRNKSASKPKPRQQDVVEVAPAPVPTTKKKGKRAATPTQEDEEEVVSAPPAKPKGKAVPRTKAKAEPREPVFDEVESTAVDNYEPSRKPPRSVQAGTGHPQKSPSDRKSSLSEDAGYATAEPPLEPDQMGIDEDRAPPIKAKAKTKAKGLSTAGATPPPPTSTDAATRTSVTADGVRSSVEPSSRTSHPPAKSNKDSLKVIEIDSDGGDADSGNVPPQSKVKVKGAPTRSVSGSSSNKTRKPSGSTSKNSRPPAPKARSPSTLVTEDTAMDDALPASPRRAKPQNRTPDAEPPAPGTPISAVHRSAPPSPVREQKDEADIDMDQSELPITEPSAEPPRPSQTYHPFLAQFPIEELTKLTEEEAAMTVEQYIRREMEVQYALIKEDAERHIEGFKQKAVETQRVIKMS